MSKQSQLTYKCDAPASVFSLKGGKDFCSKCQTSVIDMREMEDDEIRKIVAAHGGNLCVRIHSDQLNRVKGKTSTVRKSIAVAATAALLALTTESSAQISDSVRLQQAHTVPGSEAYPRAIPADTTATSTATSVATGQEGMILPDPVATRRPLKKRTFLRIGRRSFYVMNRAPFFGTRRTGWMGKF